MIYKEFCEEPFSAKYLDKRLEGLVTGLSTYFNMSTKLTFLFLASYGIKKQIDISTYECQGQGPQFRWGTDSDINPYIDILLAKVVKIHGNNEDIAEVLTTKDLYERYFNLLFNYANQSGLYLLNNELSSYKNGVRVNSVSFVQDCLAIFAEFESMDVF